MNAPARGSGDKKDTLKALIRQLHAGGDPQALKKKFKTLLASLSPEDVARVEEELIAEGMSREQVEQLCDVHLEVFREALEKDKPLLPPGHPLAILMAEHSALLEQASRLQQATEALFKRDTLGEVRQQMEVIRSAATTFRNSESHYLREENVLFPSLEKHGITEPPAIMWREHDRIRELKKQFYALLDEGQRDFASFRRRVNESAKAINQMLAEHFYK
ncbi:MAG TPA: DUF438 domain-containing protein, partial [Firmicutes bacterium]|nr:DUF438 domain-containing protein [Bacillota bacterium]